MTRFFPIPSVLFLPAFFLLQSCYIADVVLVEESEPPISLQQECQRSVTTYIKSNCGDLIYAPYSFSAIEIHVPQEIIVLEDMEKNRAEDFLSGPETDSIINAKREFIEANNIQRTIYLKHSYVLRNNNKTLTILETNFILNDTLGVFEFTPLILLTVPDSCEIALNYYMNEYTVFSSLDINEARRLSNRFYYFFKKRQQEITGVQDRSNFLLHALKATQFVIEKGNFVADEFIKRSTEEYMNQKSEIAKSYLPLAFSPLYEKTSDGKITGYYIFHKFSLTKNDSTELYAIRLEISPYYEILTTTLLEAPFDSYFN